MPGFKIPGVGLLEWYIWIHHEVYIRYCYNEIN